MNPTDVHNFLSELHFESTKEDRAKRQRKIKRMKKLKKWLGLLILTIVVSSCTTPAITTYQKGTCIGDRAEIRETLNLNESVKYYPCKCDSGEKVIIKRKLN